MMVRRRRTGWEHLDKDPALFFEKVLLLKLTDAQVRTLEAIADGDHTRLGLVWDHFNTPEEVDGLPNLTINEPTLACGMVLWRAAACHRPTLLWGGRRITAEQWAQHTATILGGARPELRNGARLVTGTTERPGGLLLANGAWAMRYDGPYHEDALAAAESLGYCADVLIGDFQWVGQESCAAAGNYVKEHGGLLTVVVAADGP